MDYSSVMSTRQPNTNGPTYGSTNEFGEPITVKSHLQDLEVSLYSFNEWL